MNQHLSTTSNAAERMSPSSPQTPSECVSVARINRGDESLPLNTPRSTQQRLVSSSISGAPQNPVSERTLGDEGSQGPRVLSLGEALHRALNQASELDQDVELNNCWYAATFGIIGTGKE